eukprot:1136567-Pelagomonas_calceolata.AAC.2
MGVQPDQLCASSIGAEGGNFPPHVHKTAMPLNNGLCYCHDYLVLHTALCWALARTCWLAI